MTSALKSVGALEPSFFGLDQESDYGKKYKNAQDAETRLMELLQQRQERTISPSMLGLAGELLDPGRTGSFGEALGRGAKSYAVNQALEDKQLQENAMMRMQLANMQLENASSAQASNMAKPLIQKFLGTGQPPAPGAPANVAAPTGTGAAPVEGGGTPPAAAASPTVSIGGYNVNPDTIAAMKMIPSMKSIADALETQYKLRMQAIHTQPGYYIDLNRPEGQQVVPVPPPGAADVEIRFPEKGANVSLMGAPEDLIALRNARNTNNVKEVDRIFSKLKFGAQAPAGGKAVSAEQPEGASSVQEAKEAAIRGEKVSGKLAEDQAAETSAFLKNDSLNRESMYTSSRIIKNAKDNPQLYGILKDPTIGNAFASFVKTKAEGPNATITQEALEDFFRKSNYNTSKQDMVKLAEMSSDLARLHFNFRKTLLAGEGSVSNLEDAGVSKIQGNTSDPAEFLISMAQLTGRRNRFDVDVAQGLRQYQRSNGSSKTLEDFRRDSPEYQRLLKGYENWIEKTYELPSAKGQNAEAPPVSMLKEGENTTFKNGQIWTLKNGVPTKVK